MQALSQSTIVVRNYLLDHPLATNQNLYESFPDIGRAQLRRHRQQYLKRAEALNLRLPTRITPADQHVQIPFSQTDAQPPIAFNEADVDSSFKKLIAYAKYASRAGVDIGTNTILSHLDKTDQLIASEQELIEYAELMDQIETAWEEIQNAHNPPNRIPHP